jgi:hypothetical protein
MSLFGGGVPPMNHESILVWNVRGLNGRLHRENNRITIERQRERCRNIKGCNLEREFDSLAPV